MGVTAMGKMSLWGNDKNVLNVDIGDGYPTLHIQKPLNCMLGIGEFCALWILSQ